MRTWVPGPIAALSVALLLVTPAAVYASFTSVSPPATNTATMTGDGTSDTLIITAVGNQFRHNRFVVDPGFESDIDFDSAAAGIQTVTTGGTIHINAGDGDDVISVGDFLSLKGNLDGGAGIDTLDYSAFAVQAVHVNLGLSTTGLNATLGGDQEAPVPTTHAGTGTASVTGYNLATRTFDISVSVSGLAAADVTGFHIHYGWVGTPGGILLDLSPLASLVPSGSGFTFNATGVAWPAGFEAALLGGATYVNVHTAAFPNGAIRGQLVSAGNAGVATGTAFGVAGVTGFERALGGTSSDSLVGSSAANILDGGAGQDQILGGPGGDSLSGGADADLLIWSNGDGTDVIEGGDGHDYVQVNGSPTGDDELVVSANGTRIQLERPLSFSLDIGTVEELIVAGHGGADSFTVNDPAGAEFNQIALFGFDGNDQFTMVPSQAGTHTYFVHGGPGSDTLQGPNSPTTWSVSVPNVVVVIGLINGARLIETINGGSGNDVFNVKAFASGTPAVSGGAGSDTLNYDAEGRTVSGDTTPPDGAIISPGVQAFAFAQMETVFVNNAQNTVPTITAIADQTILANSNTGALAFTIGDGETPAASLTLSAASSNTTLAPLAGIAFGGSGANRTVTVTPALNQVGTSTITVTVTDGNGTTAADAFVLTVNGPTTVQAPSNLYVSAMAGNQVTFRFTPSPLGPPATGFILEGGVSPGEVLGSITGSDLPILSATVPTGSFYVRLHGTRGAERSGPSNEIRIHVNAPVAPSAPDMFSSAVNGSTVVLSWRNTFGGGAPTGVLLDVTGGATTTLPLGLTESTVVSGAPGGTFTLRLRSQNAGGASPQSSAVTVTIPSACTGAPEVPSNFLAYRIGSTGYVVWDPPAAGAAPASYVVNVSGSYVGTFATSMRSLSGAVGPGSYLVTVAAVNPCGSSPPTPAQTIVVP